MKGVNYCVHIGICRVGHGVNLGFPGAQGRDHKPCPGILVSYHCGNTSPNTEWLKTAHIYYVLVLEVRNAESASLG